MATSTRGDDSHGNSTSWSYAYNGNGNITEATSGGGLGINFRYCWRNGHVTRIDPVTATGTAANGAKPDGQAENCDAAQGDDTLLTYNSADQLTNVNRPAGGDTSYTYDNLSRIATVTTGRGVTTTTSTTPWTTS